MAIKYDKLGMQIMNSFDSITHTKLKDFFEQNNTLVFIVQENQIGKAVGKGGANVNMLKRELKKNIKIVEFNNDRIKFVRNYIYPLKAKSITEEGDIVVIEGPDTKTKGLLIGRQAQNLRALEKVVRRYFKVDEIKVV